MASANPLYIVFVGPPGAGKGTQAAIMEKEFGLKQISSGDLFRENLKNNTELGKLARGFMDRGELVPDDVTISMVIDRIGKPDCARGVIFDGFPRTLAQARALDYSLAECGCDISVAPALVVSDEVIEERITGRRVCRSCDHVYHITYNPPPVEGECGICGGELYQRSDDTPETVRNRLFVYYKQTSPLIGYYFASYLLREIDGDQAIGAVSRDLVEAVSAALDR